MNETAPQVYGPDSLMDRILNGEVIEESLALELKAALRQTSFGTMIQHYLVQDLFYMPNLNSVYNARLKAMTKSANEALETKNYWKYLILVNRPFRLSKFIENIYIHLDKTTKLYWDLVAWLWTDSESPYVNKDAWLYIFEDANSYLMMDEEELNTFNALPEEVTIYRGVQRKNCPRGLSWTLDKEKAIWFANRYKRDKISYVMEAKISKDKIIAYINGRNESEILINPKYIKKIKTHEFK